MRNKKALFWTPALLLLAAVFVFVNLPPRYENVQAGSAPGERPADFTVTCLDGGVFSLGANRGKTVVINLWATWCAPCVKELAFFDRLQRERKDVAVLALHSEPVTEDVSAFVEARGWETLRFAVDPDGAVSAALSDSAVLPRTVVIAPDGTVMVNRVGGVDYETLSRWVDEAAGK